MTGIEYEAIVEFDGEPPSSIRDGELVATESDEDGDEVTGDPEIDEWEISTRYTGPVSRADIEWEVSDDDGALDEVRSELVDTDGDVLNRETSDVSGSSASREHELRTRDDPNEVRLTVVDEDDNSTSEIEEYE